MLYDPKWKQKADPMAYETFIGWLEQQPSDGRYCYGDHGACLCASYLTAMGYEGVDLYSCGDFAHTSRGKRVEGQYPVQMDNLAVEQPWTFGAALQRAKMPRYVW